ncbi:hypothetical protein K9N50_00705 [bacterium]|nr:hypothetical protein [bacterium]
MADSLDLAQRVKIMEVQEAAKKAKKYLLDLSTEPLNSVMLEEIELGEKSWFITFSYTNAAGLYSKYRIIEIDAETGNFISMKIRTLN